MSHVMNVRWNNNDKYLFSAGGLDCCTFQWLHTEKDGNPAISDENEMLPPPTSFGAGPAAEQMEVFDPDDGYQEKDEQEEQQQLESAQEVAAPTDKKEEAPAIENQTEKDVNTEDGAWGGEGEEDNYDL